MKGHEELLELRKSGLQFPEVVVTDLPNKGQLPRTIEIQNSDVIDTLDLRFLKDTMVHVSVFEGRRGQRIADACAQFASRVVASFYEEGERKSVRMTDTQDNKEWKF